MKLRPLFFSVCFLSLIFLKAQPPDPALDRAEWMFAHDSLPEAKAAFEKLNGERSGKDATVIQYLGLIGIRNNDYTSAEKYFRRAAKIQPADSSHLFHRGYCQEKRQKFNAALRTYRRAADAAGGIYPAAFARMGVVHRAIAEDPEAIQAFNNAITQDAFLADAWMERGKTWAGLGEFNKARADFQSAAVLLKENAGAVLRMAQMDLLRGESTSAVKVCTQVIEADSGDMRAYLLRGYAAALAGLGHAATADALKCSAADRNDPLALRLLMSSYIAQKNYKAAEELLQSFPEKSRERCWLQALWHIFHPDQQDAAQAERSLRTIPRSDRGTFYFAVEAELQMLRTGIRETTATALYRKYDQSAFLQALLHPAK